jgi:hypothetical protein
MLKEVYYKLVCKFTPTSANKNSACVEFAGSFRLLFGSFKLERTLDEDPDFLESTVIVESCATDPLIRVASGTLLMDNRVDSVASDVREPLMELASEVREFCTGR